jgi:hypothetical protein
MGHMKNPENLSDLSRQSRPNIFTHRPVVAMVLLFAWLLFWITAILPPCSVPPTEAINNDSGSTQIASNASAGSELLPPNYTDHNDDACCHVTSTALAVLDQQLLHSANADQSSPLMFAGYTISSLAFPGTTTAFAFEQPPPPYRVYLSTLRLRI